MRPTLTSGTRKSLKTDSKADTLAEKFPGLAIPNEPQIPLDGDPEEVKQAEATDKEVVDDLMAQFEADAPSKNVESSKEEKRKEKEAERRQRRSRSRRRDRSRSRDRYRSRHRERSKDRRTERWRHRRSSNDRSRRSRSRDRRSRTRSRERRRSGERKRSKERGDKNRDSVDKHLKKENTEMDEDPVPGKVSTLNLYVEISMNHLPLHLDLHWKSGEHCAFRLFCTTGRLKATLGRISTYFTVESRRTCHQRFRSGFKRKQS